MLDESSIFQGFDKLISLELLEVTISFDLLKRLISHCSLLKQVVLSISEILYTIKISAPMLRSFDFRGDMSSICLKNVPRRVKVTQQGEIMLAEDLDFANVFESCSALLSFDFFVPGIKVALLLYYCALWPMKYLLGRLNLVFL